ncbi:hypothetical protein M0R45_010771 [Rubus argutus]|uniref:Uncharacterized protein n=1 Tax=Rubus argutus TaxID=59490 RepID=A0AAW1Y8Z5_RUBAR
MMNGGMSTVNRDGIWAFIIKVIGVQILATIAAGVTIFNFSPSSGIRMLESQLLTTAVFANFEFYGPHLLTSLMALGGFGLIQVFFPLGKIAKIIYRGAGLSIVPYCIVYATDHLIKYHYSVY